MVWILNYLVNRKHEMKLNLQRIALSGMALAALITSVTGCAPLVIGGAVMAGSMVITDRRTTGSQLEDEGIEMRSATTLHKHFGEKVHINITSYNRQVLLTGEVPTEQDRLEAEQLARKIVNVTKVVNELAVMPLSALSLRTSDSYITAKVKTTALNAKNIPTNAFKVVTERGIVYLMGRVTQDEALRLTEITRGVGGVKKVVRIFEVINESELRVKPVATVPAS